MRARSIGRRTRSEMDLCRIWPTSRSVAKGQRSPHEDLPPRVRRIHAKAEQRGIGIILENHPQGLLADAKTIAGFLDAEGYSSVPVIYDVANAFAIGEDPVAGLATLWARLGIVHLSDSPRGQWRHDPIGTGAIDFSAIATFLGDKGFEGAVVLEILSDAPLQGVIDGVASLRADGFTFQAAARL